MDLEAAGADHRVGVRELKRLGQRTPVDRDASQALIGLLRPAARCEEHASPLQVAEVGQMLHLEPIKLLLAERWRVLGTDQEHDRVLVQRVRDERIAVGSLMCPRSDATCIPCRHPEKKRACMAET